MCCRSKHSVPEFLHVDDYINACMFKKKISSEFFLENYKSTYILFLESYHQILSAILNSDNKVIGIYILLRAVDFSVLSPQPGVPN